jgi:hypothetical protein
MTNVMRAYQKQQYQLLHDAPHRVARRLAQDIHSFFARADCNRRDKLQHCSRQQVRAGPQERDVQGVSGTSADERPRRRGT